MFFFLLFALLLIFRFLWLVLSAFFCYFTFLRFLLYFILFLNILFFLCVLFLVLCLIFCTFLLVLVGFLLTKVGLPAGSVSISVSSRRADANPRYSVLVIVSPTKPLVVRVIIPISRSTKSEQILIEIVDVSTALSTIGRFGRPRVSSCHMQSEFGRFDTNHSYKRNEDPRIRNRRYTIADQSTLLEIRVEDELRGMKMKT